MLDTGELHFCSWDVNYGWNSDDRSVSQSFELKDPIKILNIELTFIFVNKQTYFSLFPRVRTSADLKVECHLYVCCEFTWIALLSFRTLLAVWSMGSGYPWNTRGASTAGRLGGDPGGVHREQQQQRCPDVQPLTGLQTKQHNGNIRRCVHQHFFGWDVK